MLPKQHIQEPFSLMAFFHQHWVGLTLAGLFTIAAIAGISNVNLSGNSSAPAVASERSTSTRSSSSKLLVTPKTEPKLTGGVLHEIFVPLSQQDAALYEKIEASERNTQFENMPVAFSANSGTIWAVPCTLKTDGGFIYIPLNRFQDKDRTRTLVYKKGEELYEVELNKVLFPNWEAKRSLDGWPTEPWQVEMRRIN